MQILKLILGVFVGVPLLVFVVFWLIGFDKLWHLLGGPADMGDVELKTFTKTSKPNQYLVCPEGYCENETADKVSPIYSLSAQELSDALLVSLQSERNLQRVDEETDPLRLRFVQRTEKMRYPDTIRVEIIPVNDTQSSLAIYGQSQIGRKDFGVNKARILRWLRRLENHVSR